MGLFGLGIPEVAVIAGIAVLVFGMLWSPFFLDSSSFLNLPLRRQLTMQECLLQADDCAGPSKLPELGRELGKSVKSFQTAAKV